MAVSQLIWRIKMKNTITQYVTLGVMLLLLVLIVSMYPEQNTSKSVSHKESATTVSKLSIQTHTKQVRTD